MNYLGDGLVQLLVCLVAPDTLMFLEIQVFPVSLEILVYLVSLDILQHLSDKQVIKLQPFPKDILLRYYKLIVALAERLKYGRVLTEVGY